VTTSNRRLSTGHASCCGPLVRLVLTAAALVVCAGGSAHGQSARVQFVFTSDVHYGITRQTFQGRSNVDAHVVNAAMITSRTITVRECLWDVDPGHPLVPLAWGGSTTVALSPRPAN
jgi:hypothetical protein